MRKFLMLAALVAVPGLAQAEGFTTAAEVRPILEATKTVWVAVREYEGRDLLYFTQILAWRCGLDGIRYGLNGAEAETVLKMEPCHEGTAAPNAITMDEGVVYLTLPLKSLERVSVQLLLDDGSVLEAAFDRKSILMP